MLSNTATPIYYGQFRDAVLRGEKPVNREISLEMNRIDELIRNPGIYYDDQAIEGFIAYCEDELTLTDGSDLHLLDSFKLWAEQIFGWYYFVERSIYEPNPDGKGGHYVRKMVKKRLINKQYLIVARGAAKSMYGSCIQNYFLNVDTTTTHQVTTSPTMKQSEEIMSPIRTAITRARGPLFQFLTEGSLQNTTGSKANRQKLASTKNGIENFYSGTINYLKESSADLAIDYSKSRNYLSKKEIERIKELKKEVQKEEQKDKIIEEKQTQSNVGFVTVNCNYKLCQIIKINQYFGKAIYFHPFVGYVWYVFPLKGIISNDNTENNQAISEDKKDDGEAPEKCSNLEIEQDQKIYEQERDYKAGNSYRRRNMNFNNYYTTNYQYKKRVNYYKYRQNKKFCNKDYSNKKK